MKIVTGIFYLEIKHSAVKTLKGLNILETTVFKG
jgi:hypothetical protein